MQSGWWNRAMPGTTRTSVSALGVPAPPPDGPRASSVAAAPALAGAVLAAASALAAAVLAAASALVAAVLTAAGGAGSGAPLAAAALPPVLGGVAPLGDLGDLGVAAAGAAAVGAAAPVSRSAGAASPVSLLAATDADPAAVVAARGGRNDPAWAPGRVGPGAARSAGVAGRSLVAGPLAGDAAAVSSRLSGRQARLTDDDPAGIGPASGSA
jgi:hypothetical protein